MPWTVDPLRRLPRLRFPHSSPLNFPLPLCRRRNVVAGICRWSCRPTTRKPASVRPSPRRATALAELTADYEILVVDDGSRDDTAAIVAEMAATRPRLRLLRHVSNRGYGAALRTGFAAARFERVAFTDADCQFHLADLGRLLSLSERFPLVVGWRQARQDPWRRRFLSRGYNLLTRTLLGTRVRDCDCALKVFHRDVLAALLPETNTFFVNAEMLAKARQLGLDVAEVGVRHRPRLRGASKVSLGEVPRTLATLVPFWWSRVLFAGDERFLPSPPLRGRGVGGEGAASPPHPLPLSPEAGERGERRRSGRSLALLVLLAATLFFLRLRAPLLEPQEPRYAEIPRQMLQEGRLLVPVLHGQPYLDKPPLLYWLVMGSYGLFGVHDWSARLVPGLAGVLTVLLTYGWGRRAVGERAGLCGALVLCLSAGFVYRQRMLNMDSLLCLWVTAALASAHRALTTGPLLRRRWGLTAAVACGLGLLTKGPVALVLIGTPLLLYRCLEPRCARVSFRAAALFVLLAVAVAAPWYVAVMVREPDFAYSFFWRHHVERFLTPFDHEKPAWFYLPGLLAGMLPWTLLLPGFVRYLARRSPRAARRRPAALGFFLLSALWCVLFFSASGCKRPAYILPAMPPLALALGCYLNVLVPHGRRLSGAGLLLLWRWRSAAASAGDDARAGAGPGDRRRWPAGKQMSASWLWPSCWRSLAACGLALGCTRRISWGVCAAVTFVVLGLGVYHLQPAYNRQFALRGHLRGDTDLADGTRLPVVCYPQRWDSVSFYLPRADVRVYTLEQRRQMLADLRSRPRTLLLVKSGKVLDDLLRELSDSIEFVAHGRPGVVTAGWVRPRREPSEAAYARR